MAAYDVVGPGPEQSIRPEPQRGEGFDVAGPQERHHAGPHRERSRSPKRDAPSDSRRHRGTVARWNSRGFGFIVPEGGGEDIFVHNSNIEDGDALERGASVEYCQAEDDRPFFKGKWRAEKVVGGFWAHENPHRIEAPKLCLGTVLRWNEKGFGFIKEDGGDGQDLFIHHNDIEDSHLGEALWPGGACLWCMPMVHAYGACLWRMPMAHAYGHRYKGIW